MESIDILFVPSYFDGWGVIVNEGIAKSCAIVSSNKVYAGLSMIDGNGFIFSDNFIKYFELYFKNNSLLNDHKNNSERIFDIWNSVNSSREFYNYITYNDTDQNKILRLI